MSFSNKIYPWQQAVWLNLHQNRSRLHHAYLLQGRVGIGKLDFAIRFSQSLLCDNTTEVGEPCHQCPSCHWFADESHPDFRLIGPEQDAVDDESITVKKTKKKSQISVAQIRELTDFLNMSSHQASGMKVVLIHPAEAMNQASANALLKMLEEPAPGVIFILVTHHHQQLLPTIVSRCQRIKMPVPTESESLAWLAEQNVQNAHLHLAYNESSPIKVLNEQEEFSRLGDIWHSLSLGQKLEPSIIAPQLVADGVEPGIIAFQKWLYDLTAVKLTRKARYHLQYLNALQALAERVNLSKLFDLQRKTNELRKLASHPLNHEVQMECLLLEYTKLFNLR